MRAGQGPRSSVPVRARPLQGRRAGLASRTLANLVDGAVVCVVLAGGYLGLVLAWLAWGGRDATLPHLPVPVTVVLAEAAATAYLTGAWSTTGRTYGAHLLGLRVLGKDATPPRWSTALARAVLCTVFPVGLLWVGAGRENRSVQDILLRTSVIHDWSGVLPPADGGAPGSEPPPRPGRHPDRGTSGAGTRPDDGGARSGAADRRALLRCWEAGVVTSELNPNDGLAPDERAELTALRAEVAALRAESHPARASSRRSTGRARRGARAAAATALVVVSCVLAPLSVVSVWARSEVTDTDRYVETIAPLADDPAVQRAVTAEITDTIFRYVDVQSLTSQAFTALSDRGSLPPGLADQLQALAVPVANGIRSFTAARVLEVVRSDAFARAWVTANRTAHEQLVAALEGESGSGVLVEGNAVKLDLAAFLAVVKQRLVAAGFALAARIPTVNATFVVFESPDVARVQRAFTVLDALGLWLPFILVALAALGIYAAPRHRLAFMGAGLGLAVAMLVAAVGLAVVRRVYLAGVPSDVLPPDAAAGMYDTLVRFLRETVNAGILIGVMVAGGAFLTGPAVTATVIRGWFVAGFVRVRSWLAGRGLGLPGLTRWVAPRARFLRALLVTAALAVLLVERYRTPQLVWGVAGGVLIGLAAIQFLASDTSR